MKPYDYNKYFILLLPEQALAQILEHCIEKTVDRTRTNNSKTKHIVKLPMNSTIPNILQNKTVYNHSEILVELSKPEWVSEII